MSTTVEAAIAQPRGLHSIEDLERLDLAIYAAVAGTTTPARDVAMGCLPRAVAYSRVHTGERYPAGVLAGVVRGTAPADLTRHAGVHRRWGHVARAWRPPEAVRP